MPTDIEEVHKTIMQLKQKKSPGHDNIRSETLKNISDENPFWGSSYTTYNGRILEEVLLEQDICLLNTGAPTRVSPPGHGPSAPDVTLCSKDISLGLLWSVDDISPSLKDTIFIPICKPGKSPDDPLSYRPIALTSCLLKLLESLLVTRLDRIYESSMVEDEIQFGFRKGKSVLEALSFLTANIYCSFAKGEVTLAVFLDIKQAYDSVNFHILEASLRSENFPEEIISLLRPLVLSRSIFLIDPLTRELLGPEEANLGLAQGSPMSPPLFNFYVKDLGRSISTPGVRVLKFADDTTLFASGPDFQSVFDTMSLALSRLEAWAKSKQLEISVVKSHAVCFHKSRLFPNSPSFSLFGRNIPWKESVKYLGVTLDRKLKWSQHISDACYKAFHGINLIRTLSRTWWGSHPSTLLVLYRSTVRPHIDYGSILFGAVPRKNLYLLDKTQYTALRSCLGMMRSTPINILLALAGELPLKYRRIWLGAKFISKLLRFKDDCVLDSIKSLQRWSNLPLLSSLPLLDSLNIIDDPGSIYSDSSLPCHQGTISVHTQKIPLHSLGLKKDNPDNSSLFLKKCDEVFPNTVKIYTDASKSGYRVGIGVYYPSLISLSQSLPGFFSICTAELIAIQRAISLVACFDVPHSVIFSDSKSALEKISNWSIHSSNDDITLDIRNKVISLQNSGRSISLAWVPGHTCIPGNISADSLAKEGASLPHSNPVKADAREFWPLFKKTIWERWKREWVHIGRRKGRCYTQMTCPDSLNKPWFHGLDLPRLYLTTINRIRSSHCSIPPHLFKINVRDSDACVCGEKGDLLHIFLQCPNNQPNIHKFYADVTSFLGSKIPLPLSLEDVLFSNDPVIIKTIVNFLYASGWTRI
ncbi:uncharacterized protein LOC123322405 [Coccinella septempunctata]|uniref:uncharacterized protein LOC123322405 n=1 Tax=Coccinella septempunctata TaxID=41139 RepID=UPI001D094F52|nr:uncharacterized protein LOC123322405 [Coccinella septempunctata]